MMAKRSEPALSKPEARTGPRGRATDEVKVRGFHQGRSDPYRLQTGRIYVSKLVSLSSKADGLAPGLGPYMFGPCVLLSGRDDPSAAHGLENLGEGRPIAPRLTQIVGMLKIQG
jgi:hypothetical protein